MWVLESLDAESAAGAKLGQALSLGKRPKAPWEDVAAATAAVAGQQPPQGMPVVASVPRIFGQLRNVEYGWAVELEGVSYPLLLERLARDRKLANELAPLLAHVKLTVLRRRMWVTWKLGAWRHKQLKEAEARREAQAARVEAAVVWAQARRRWRRQAQCWPLRKHILKSQRDLKNLKVVDVAGIDELRVKAMQPVVSEEGFRAIQEAMPVLISQGAKFRRQQHAKEQKELKEMEVKAVLNDPETQSLRLRLKWDAGQTERFAHWRVTVQNAVGIEEVKEYLEECIADAIGRKEGAEQMRPPHTRVLLDGVLGTGKRTAAELISRLGKILQWVAEDCTAELAPGHGGQGVFAYSKKDDGDNVPQSQQTRVNMLEVFMDPMRAIDPPPLAGGNTHAFSGDFEADDGASHVTEVPYDSLDPEADPPLEVDPSFVYFVKVPTVTDRNKPTDEKQGVVLQKIEHHGSVCILAGAPEDLDYFTKLRCFRVTSPKRLALPALGKYEIACISVKLVQRDGLRLHKSSDPHTLLSSGPPKIPMLHRSTTTERSQHRAKMRLERDVLVMEFIVSQRFDDTEIKTRNAWLGTDMLTLAKSKRNQRLVRQEKATVQEIMAQDCTIDHHCALYAASALSSAQRMHLTPVDFDVKMLTKEEKQKRRNKVLADIRSMVGWGSAGPAAQGDGQLELTPKAFFSQARKILEGLERQREQDQSAGEKVQDWNLVITGDAGTGKLAFATLFQQFLRAFGALETDTFLEKAVHEMKLGGSGKSSTAVTKVFQDAAPGMVFIKGAGAFLGHEQDGVAKEDAAGKEAMATLKKELAANFSTVVVCMSDTKEAMSRLLRSDRGLDQRFGWRVHVPAFSATDCALVVQRDARMSPGGKILLEPGLLEALAKHIKANYEGVQNARLAVQLTKAAKVRGIPIQ
jgi:hypothetical protein